MSESPSKPTLNQLIDEAREVAVEQQSVTRSSDAQRPSRSRFKTVIGLLMLSAFGVILFVQYPHIQAPYDWPDAKSSPALAEADLNAVASLIEAYRFSQGQYPSVLSQVTLPAGLAALAASTVLVYQPVDASYTLDWTLPHWHARYDGKTGKVTVEPLGKH